MIRDITLGQYYQTDSFLHRLDPRTKLFGTLIYIISLFVNTNIYVYSCVILFFIMLVKISNVPFKYMVRGMKPIAVLLIFTFILNLFMTPGEQLLKIGVLTITKEGMDNSLFTSLRLIMLVLGSSLLTLTTSVTRLTDGLEKSLGFLKIIKVPVHELAMMMSIALRFIPVLLEETDRIMKAQLSRGADFESGSLVKKIKSTIPIIIPLFASAFKRAADLSLAMEARCYNGGASRTKMNPLKYNRLDGVAYIGIFIYLIFIIVLGIFSKAFPLGNGLFGA